MRTLCPKGGKIHPSPSGAGGWGDDPIAAAFHLLPAAILFIATALGPEDQEVLAYLVTRPLQGEGGKAAAGVLPSEQPPPAPARGGAPRRAHPPTLGCGCFQCYGSYWSRWDSSPHRDLILDALQAFEEHLAATESSATPPSSKRRDKGKRSRLVTTPPRPPSPQPPMLIRPKSPEPQVEQVQELSAPLPPSCPPPPPPAPAAYIPEEKDKAPEPSPEAEAAEETEKERKRGWADVMGGMLGLRLWGIWSPAVENAT